MSDISWLPKLELFEEYNDWNKYEEALYAIFKNDFIDNTPDFDKKKIKFRWAPVEYGKPDAFFHVTCQDYDKNMNRVPDIRRCERIRWIREFIQRSNSTPNLCDESYGIKAWRQPYKNKKRVCLLLEEERYIVVLEPRPNYYLLITAFYIEHDHYLEKKLKSYIKYKE